MKKLSSFTMDSLSKICNAISKSNRMYKNLPEGLVDGMKKLDVDCTRKGIFYWQGFILKSDQSPAEVSINNKINELKQSYDVAVPFFYAVHKEVVVMDFVEGVTIEEQGYITQKQYDLIQEEVSFLLENGIAAFDLHEGNIIINKKGIPIIIDTDGFVDLNDSEYWNYENAFFEMENEMEYLNQWVSDIKKRRNEYVS